MAKEDNLCASESSSEAGSLSGESSEESALEDMFQVEDLPRTARTWLTEQDAEQDGIARFAEYLRDQPLLPAHSDDPEGLRSFDDIEELDKGIHLPFVQCAFKKCKWHVTHGGRPPLSKFGEWRYSAPEHFLRLHLYHHMEESRSSLGVKDLRPEDVLDYYEEAVKFKCREHIPITSLSQDRRTGASVSSHEISFFWFASRQWAIPFSPV